MSELMVYDRNKGLGEMDRVLLAGAASHKSAKELSALTNGVISPAEALLRVEKILDSRDILTEAHNKMLLLDEMFQVKDILMEQVSTFKNMDQAKPLIAILNQIDKTMASEKFDITKAMTEITRAQGAIMLEGIKIALEMTFRELSKRYPAIQKSELNDIFIVAMPSAVHEIEGRVTINE